MPLISAHSYERLAFTGFGLSSPMNEDANRQQLIYPRSCRNKVMVKKVGNDRETTSIGKMGNYYIRHSIPFRLSSILLLNVAYIYIRLDQSPGNRFSLAQGRVPRTNNWRVSTHDPPHPLQVIQDKCIIRGMAMLAHRRKSVTCEGYLLCEKLGRCTGIPLMMALRAMIL